jgi:hypothetical protein
MGCEIDVCTACGAADHGCAAMAADGSTAPQIARIAYSVDIAAGKQALAHGYTPVTRSFPSTAIYFLRHLPATTAPCSRNA